jgi:hypothetical protein
MIESACRHGPRLIHVTHVSPHRRDAERSQAAVVSAALRAWEGEGGAPLESRTRASCPRPVAQMPDQAGIA